MRHSLYWDDFERRINETVIALQNGKTPPVRRVAVFITDRCNFKCEYCNSQDNNRILSESRFKEVLEKYGNTALIHITGGEPSMVPWLYPLIRKTGNKYRYHLNTNAFITPPYESIKRLKISLDHYDAEKWNSVVGRNAFNKVIENIKLAMKHTVVSLTYTLSKKNYLDSIKFVRFVKREFPDLYAIFFSVYKGINPDYAITDRDADRFFDEVLPKLKKELSNESLALIRETIDEKRRLIQGVRFPSNKTGHCYISMSERVISPDGNEFACSHLYRDNIFSTEPVKHEKCLYGCNRRLVQFNEQVSKGLTNE